MDKETYNLLKKFYKTKTLHYEQENSSLEVLINNNYIEEVLTEENRFVNEYGVTNIVNSSDFKITLTGRTIYEQIHSKKTYDLLTIIFVFITAISTLVTAFISILAMLK
ncbi:TPA: hypothetical protein ACSVR1_003474 [Clostridioides difficile]|nr:hypothetical protein [Clostridioides difficile]HBG0995672.1 hypothetical protein [Clostridioides difficile]HCQ6278645.1 hypothetical protein [Clostridioides difficile]